MWDACREQYSRLGAPYCDFSLNNLLIWFNQSDDLELSACGECRVMRFSSVFDNGRRRYALFGTRGVERAVREILEFLRKTGEEPGLCMVPEETVAQMTAREGLHIEEERENADYVIHLETAHALKGRRYSNLRGRVNTFRNRYKEIRSAELGLDDPRTRRSVGRSILDWSAGKFSRQNDREGWEARAIARHLELAGSIPVRALGTYLANTLVAVSIYHFPPQQGWVIINHLKCDYRYREVFGYAYHQFVRQMRDEGMTWLNVEQDLGRPGLRRTKLLLRPHHFLKRYSLSLSTEAVRDRSDGDSTSSGTA